MLPLELNVMLLMSLMLLASSTTTENSENTCVEWPDSKDMTDPMVIESDRGPCVTTVTASTTLGVSLVQAVSARARLTAGKLKEGERAAEVPAKSSKHNIVAEQSGEDQHAPCPLHRAMSAASSLMQQGQMFGHSAFASIRSGPSNLRTVVMASTGALIFAFFLLIIIGACAFLVMFHPATMGKYNNSSFEGSSEGETFTRYSPNATRAYFPMTASPQLSMRGGTQPSPQASQKQIGGRIPSEASPGGRFKTLARGLDVSSDDEKERAPRWTASTAGSRKIEAFCSELIVPQHCECILVLPIDLGKPSTSFAITDVSGAHVLRAEPQPSRDGRPWRAKITTAQGEPLVQCCEARPHGPGGQPEFHLLRQDGQLFAKLLYSDQQDRYLLTLQSGAILHFWGNFDNSAVNITDDENRLLGTTEIGSTDFDPQGTYCRLRVAPLADVGLALCGLLCIGQHMMTGRPHWRHQSV